MYILNFYHVTGSGVIIVALEINGLSPPALHPIGHGEIKKSALLNEIEVDNLVEFYLPYQFCT